MQLELAVQRVLGQLAGSLCQLMPGSYAQSCRTLSGSTIGAHVRHIIELFQALGNGYELGVVNYEKRKRDRALENDWDLACRQLYRIGEGLDRPDKPLLLEAGYDGMAGGPLLLTTNYHREVAYNLEHAIHHMALIRIGINEVGPYLVLPEEFGVAPATLQYKKECLAGS